MQMGERPDYFFANDDERLSALIDGELTPAEADALGQRLVFEPALARRLTALRVAGDRLRQVYGPVADEPLPDALIALLGADARRDEARREPAEPRVVPLRRIAALRQSWLPTSIAAGVALAIGLMLGVSLGPSGRFDAAPLLAQDASIGPDDALFEVLETLPSGQSAALAGGVSATPRLTFRTGAGAYCRELSLTSSDRWAALVGCRDEAAWRLEALIQGPGSAGPGGNDAFLPASGPVTALDPIVDALMTDVPLGAEAERDAMAAGWR